MSKIKIKEKCNTCYSWNKDAYYSYQCFRSKNCPARNIKIIE